MIISDKNPTKPSYCWCQYWINIVRLVPNSFSRSRHRVLISWDSFLIHMGRTPNLILAPTLRPNLVGGHSTKTLQ